MGASAVATKPKNRTMSIKRSDLLTVVLSLDISEKISALLVAIKRGDRILVKIVALKARNISDGQLGG